MRSLVVLLVVLAFSIPVQADWPVIQTVDSPGSVGHYSSLALDSNGNPRIAYYDSTQTHLNYAACDGSSWTIHTLDSGPYVGLLPSLALDSGDYPHISYCYGPPGATNWRQRYASQDNSGWHIQTVPHSEIAGGISSLALDSSDHPHISYMQWLPIFRHTLRYGVWDGSSWTVETVDQTGGSTGGFNSVAVDSNGRPHISYTWHAAAYGPSDLNYAVRTDSGWVTQSVDTPGYVGEGSSLALDSSDYPHISYTDRTNADLKYAWWNPALAGGAGAWDITTVDSTGSLFSWTSLALDSSGFAHMSYYNQTNQELRYAAQTDSGWDIRTVDASGAYVYQTSSLALDSSGVAHISYFDGTNQDLMYASNADDSPELGTWLLLACTGALGAAMRRMRRK